MDKFAKEQNENRKVLAHIKQLLRRFPALAKDIEYLAAQSRHLKVTDAQFLRDIFQGLLNGSKAQIRQDIFVLKTLDFKRNGYFVEFGATNGVDLSNTYLLEKEFGWTGILAEAATHWHAALKANRDAAIDTRCIWKESGQQLAFNETSFTELSTINDFSGADLHAESRKNGNVYTVETVSLQDLLDHHGAPRSIDYLSIDTEGSEFEILQQFDFDRYDIRVITCEHNHTPMRDRLFELLSSNGYKRQYMQLSQFDDWYVREPLRPYSRPLHYPHRSTARSVNRPTIVTMRVDALGGRLNALINAISIANAVELDYAFVWPAVDDKGAASAAIPDDIFSPAYLAAHRLDDMPSGNLVSASKVTQQTSAKARALVGQWSSDVTIDGSNNCFGLATFADEQSDVAYWRFRVAFDMIGWNTAIQSIIDHVRGPGFPRGLSAIHLRMGEGCFINGEWRHFLPVGKYLPSQLSQLLTEHLVSQSGKRVLITSDSPLLLKQYTQRWPELLTPDRLIPGYQDLSEAQKAFADIMVLSRAKELFAPVSSAFSRLAAHLAGVRISSPVDLMMSAQTFRSLIGINQQSVTMDSERKILARDACWYLDVLNDQLGLGFQQQLARFGANMDPQFAGVLNRLILVEARIQPTQASTQLTNRVIEFSKAVQSTHNDPLFESLTIRSMTWVIQRLFDDLDQASAINWHQQLERDYQTLSSLQTLQIHKAMVLRNLRYQIRMAQWLNACHRQDKLRFRQSLACYLSDPQRLLGWRPSGQSLLDVDSDSDFPQVLRNTEMLSVALADTFRTSLKANCSNTHLKYQVEQLTTDPSGLRWAIGWAFSPEETSHMPTLLCSRHGQVVSGGVPFIRRRDVAKRHNDRTAMISGFAFPLPLVHGGGGNQNQDVLQIHSGTMS